MKAFLVVTASWEAVTGLALSLSPALPVSLLLGTALDTPGGVTVARVAGRRCSLSSASPAGWRATSGRVVPLADRRGHVVLQRRGRDGPRLRRSGAGAVRHRSLAGRPASPHPGRLVHRLPATRERFHERTNATVRNVIDVTGQAPIEPGPRLAASSGDAPRLRRGECDSHGDTQSRQHVDEGVGAEQADLPAREVAFIAELSGARAAAVGAAAPDRFNLLAWRGASEWLFFCAWQCRQ